MAKNSKPKKVINQGGGPLGWVFFVSFIGALVYFVQHSDGFWGFVLAFLKAIVWPALVTHRALELMNI